MPTIPYKYSDNVRISADLDQPRQEIWITWNWHFYKATDFSFSLQSGSFYTGGTYNFILGGLSLLQIFDFSRPLSTNFGLKEINSLG